MSRLAYVAQKVSWVAYQIQLSLGAKFLVLSLVDVVFAQPSHLCSVYVSRES